MSKNFKTFLKHTAKDYHNQSVNPPVVRASTIIFKSMQDIRKTQNKAKKDPTGGHFDYGRQGTSTTYVLQKILTKMEECYHVFLTPTGFGSVFLAIFSVVRPGDEILVADPLVTEGPFGEMFGYLGVQKENVFTMRVDKITHRKNPWIMNSYTGMQRGYITAPMEALYDILLRRMVPNLVEFHYPQNL